MSKFWLVGLSALVLLFLVVIGRYSAWYEFHFANYFQPLPAPPSSASQRLRQDPTSPPSPLDKVHHKVGQLSFEQLVGQVLMTNPEALELSAKEQEMLATGRVSGWLLLKQNIGDAEQLNRLTNLTKQSARTSEIEPLIALDQEGGVVSRIPWINSQGQAQITSPKQGYLVAKERADQLKELGINLNLAPVVEGNPVEQQAFIHRQQRAFKDQGQALAAAMVKGYSQSHILPVVKHFPPGLAQTSTDPHLKLPILEGGMPEVLPKLSLYRPLIAQEIAVLMVTHLLYPQIDQQPTSRSRVWLQYLLRDNLGFKGVIMVDDLSMGAVAGSYDIGAYAVASMEAGADLLLVSGSQSYQLAFDTLLRQARQSDRFVQRLREAVVRVLSLKEKLRNNTTYYIPEYRDEI